MMHFHTHTNRQGNLLTIARYCLILVIFCIAISGCQNKNLKVVDAKILHYNTMLDSLSVRMQDFDPHTGSLEKGIDEYVVLNDDANNLYTEIMEYIASLHVKDLKDKKDHFSREQMIELKKAEAEARKLWDTAGVNLKIIGERIQALPSVSD